MKMLGWVVKNLLKFHHLEGRRKRPGAILVLRAPSVIPDPAPVPCAQGVSPVPGGRGQVLEASVYLFPTDPDSDSCIPFLQSSPHLLLVRRQLQSRENRSSTLFINLNSSLLF